MLCTNPRFAVMHPRHDGSGKNEVIFGIDEWNDAVAGKLFPEYQPLIVPCGHCDACAYNKSRDWANRCMCELQTADGVGCFITLTYDNEHLPEGGNLVFDDVKNFNKRLRWHLNYDFSKRIRIVFCGEYGSLRGRPHYHLLIFGWKPSKNQLGDAHPSGDSFSRFVYECPYIQQIWPNGFISVCEMTDKTVGYVCRYTFKKQEFRDYNRKRKDGRVPEFFMTPRRPGLAAQWLADYWRDVYPADVFISLRGFRCPVPRYFDKLLDKYHPDIALKVLQKRNEKHAKMSRDLSTTAMKSLETIYKKRVAKCKRSLDERYEILSKYT